MIYREALKKLYGLCHIKKCKYTLDTAYALQKALFPNPSFKIIHVAGTNGKGSVTWKIQKGLTLSGIKAGLFTSPHIASFRERIRVDGACIEEERVASLFEKVEKVARKEKLTPTFFEVLFALAMLHFEEEKVDYAVLETGMGGRLDTTNVCKPHLTVITQIGMDHAEVLGDNLEKIAGEKAGIIKENTPLILGREAHFETILAKAEEKKAPIFFAPKTKSSFYDHENQEIAKEAFLQLGIDQKEALFERPPCRFEVFEDRIVFDVAHNPSAFAKLFAALDHHFPERPYRLFLSFSKDKELPKDFGRASFIHFVSKKHPRLKNLEELKNAVQTNIPHSFSKDFSSELKKAAKTKELLVFAGSFFLMGDVRAFFGIAEEKDPVEITENYEL